MLDFTLPTPEYRAKLEAALERARKEVGSARAPEGHAEYRTAKGRYVENEVRIAMLVRHIKHKNDKLRRGGLKQEPRKKRVVPW